MNRIRLLFSTKMQFAHTSLRHARKSLESHRINIWAATGLIGLILTIGTTAVKSYVHLSQATTKTEFSCRLINRAGVINHIHFAVSGYLEGEELTFAGVFSSRNTEVLSSDNGPVSNSETLSERRCQEMGSLDHRTCGPDSIEAPKIFLGGTCGDSRWRTDEAIPLLEEAGCSYYNPQLAPGTWTPELIPIEQRAKEHADCLLFVITADTRGVASMVEATELLSTGRSMVLVLTPYQQLEDLEPSSVVDDVNRGRKYLQELAARHQCPVLTDVREATVMAIDLVQAPKKTTESPQPIDHTQLVEFALKLVREQQTNCTTAAAAPEFDPWESSEGE